MAGRARTAARSAAAYAASRAAFRPALSASASLPCAACTSAAAAARMPRISAAVCLASGRRWCHHCAWKWLGFGSEVRG